VILVAPADELNLKQVVICGINRRVLLVTLAQILQFFNAIFLYSPYAQSSLHVLPTKQSFGQTYNIFWEYFPAVMVSLKTQQEKLPRLLDQYFHNNDFADAQLQSKVPAIRV